MTEIEPREVPQEELPAEDDNTPGDDTPDGNDTAPEAGGNVINDEGIDQTRVRDRLTGQTSLFDDF